jgi:hypothetical protein
MTSTSLDIALLLTKSMQFQSRRGYELRGKAKNKRDAVWLGDCDGGVEKLAELLGWGKELDELHRKGHEELKAKWIKEEEALEEEPDTLPSGKETAAEKETIDQLAEELEKVLHVPATKDENILKDDVKDPKAEDTKEDKGKKPSQL